MIKLMELIIEESKRNKFGCAMLYFSFPEISKLHDAIDVDDLYEEEDDDSFGLEKEPHTTLLFGLHSEITKKDIKKILDKYTFYECKVFNVSLFQNEKYDVLKFDVKGDNLKEVNKELSNYPHTTDYPDYHPHMTIAYLKSGRGKKYVNMFIKYDEFCILPQYAVYSQPDGSKNKISINVD